jgi:hypothetical protein
LPPPELFPKDLWAHEIDRGFAFLERNSSPEDTPPFREVVAYYRNRAPEALPILKQTKPATGCPVRYVHTGYRWVPAAYRDGQNRGANQRREPGPDLTPGVANVRFVALSSDKKRDVLICDMSNGMVLLLNPNEPNAGLRVVTDAIPNPALAEVADLNGDGIKDIVVANQGSAARSDDRTGSIVWLRGRRDGSFSFPVTLGSGFVRVNDVQVADFDGDGDLDLVVAEPGGQKSGSVQLLENRTRDSNRPVFAPSKMDAHHGAIRVRVADLNGDGRADVVALVGQEHQSVVAFLNVGNHKFERKVIYAAPHPAFGATGIELADMDGDGDQDVLLANGESLDVQLLRPYHGVQWLENEGTYPFAHHPITSMYGVQRAVAADIDGDGDQDIVAVCFLPGRYYQGLCWDLDLDAVVVLEQDAPGHFVRHSLETVSCDHATCDLGDVDGDGRIDLVTGNAFFSLDGAPIDDRSQADWVTVWKNLGPRQSDRSGLSGVEAGR